MDKRDLLEQLEAHLREMMRSAAAASAEAHAEAKNGATTKEKRADARVAMEYAGLSRGQKLRAERAARELRALSGFIPPALTQRAPIKLGAIVEVEDEETGEGRTFFLAPAGAGATLLGPGGDGHLSVVTPSSPVGRAVLGRQVGDVIDVTAAGNVREWCVTWVE